MTTPSAADDLAMMRASLLLDTDPAAAARKAGEILARSPGHEEASLLLATACRRLGDAATALGLLESLARAHPESPVMQFEVARSFAAAGRTDDALASFRRAVELDAALADAWREIAGLEFRAGRPGAGDAAYVKYLRLAKDPPQLTDAHVALAENRVEAAEAAILERLGDAPGDVVALRLLADVAGRRGDWGAAEQALNQCLDAAPGYATARYDLARLLYGQERIAELMPHVGRLLATEPDDALYLTLKAQALRLEGRIEESMAIMERLVADHPTDAELWLVFGNLLREVGDPRRTIEAFRRSIALRPGYGEAYWGLANLKTYRFTDDETTAMRSGLARSDPFSSGRVHLEFALGKALEDMQRYAESFEHYERGNVLQRARLDYHPADATAFRERSASVFTAGFFAARSGWGSESQDPIFIVGLPRSGSTLVEQILASHSQVEGTRELPDIPALVRDWVVDPAGGPPADYPDVLESLARSDIEAGAFRYLAQTAARRPLGLPRFVDKMLGNFSHVGLLHLLFPRAVIIDVRRHPMAGGFACYKQLFSRGMNFSYDLRELGLYYREYAALMAHMDEVLPGRVYRLRYEDLVASPEAEVRRLLAHCALEFEPRCLKFYENPRVVQTVSSEQVRQPIYAGGVDQWRHFELWLGPLAEALGS